MSAAPATPSKNPTCGTCAAFDATSSQCRLYPPAAIVIGGKISGQCPVVGADFWCAQWIAKA